MCGRAGWGVLSVECGWLVGPRAVRCLFTRERAGLGYLWATGLGGVVRSAWWLPRGLVGVWGASRERACLREVCGWVGDVEVVSFVQELFCLVGGDDAATDGRPCQRVFAACAYGEELLGELWCGYWAGGVFAVWVGVSECGVLGGGSDGCCAAVGFE